jgi:glyoxylase-like metal-dependent hydrolase (beta-lactamase superfamily II)
MRADPPNNRWQIGDIAVTAIVELDLDVPFVGLLPSATPDVVAEEPWMVPRWAADHDRMRLRFQALVVESGETRIVVDTCIGNDKERPGFDFMENLGSNFLSDLDTAGFAPDTIDIVTCTHLHIDHVGWNTRRVDDRWVATFPNARYLFSRVEYEHWLGECANDHMHALPFNDSVQPIVDAGLADLVEPPHELAPGVRLVPTVGHTPGHCSVEIESNGERAVITGDLAHNPIQLARPEIASSADSDQAGSTATRRAFIAATLGTDTLIIGTHFAPPSAGHLREVDGRTQLVPPAD